MPRAGRSKPATSASTTTNGAMASLEMTRRRRHLSLARRAPTPHNRQRPEHPKPAQRRNSLQPRRWNLPHRRRTSRLRRLPQAQRHRRATASPANSAANTIPPPSSMALVVSALARMARSTFSNPMLIVSSNTRPRAHTSRCGANPDLVQGSSTGPGRSPLTARATSTFLTGRTTASRSSTRRESHRSDRILRLRRRRVLHRLRHRLR